LSPKSDEPAKSAIVPVSAESPVSMATPAIPKPVAPRELGTEGRTTAALTDGARRNVEGGRSAGYQDAAGPIVHGRDLARNQAVAQPGDSPAPGSPSSEGTEAADLVSSSAVSGAREPSGEGGQRLLAGETGSQSGKRGQTAAAGQMPMVAGNQELASARLASAVPSTQERDEPDRPGLPRFSSKSLTAHDFAPTNAEKPEHRPSADPVLSHQVHSPGAILATGSGVHSGSRQPSDSQGQPSDSLLDASPLGRDAMSPKSGTAPGSIITVGPASGVSAHETFATIDQNAGIGRPSWVHAGSQHAEAGFEDPDLGWIGVRADMTASGVHAALVPASGEAARVLGGHLTGLNVYLAEQRTRVETLTLSAPEGRDQTTGQGMQQGAGQNPDHGSHAEQQSGVQAGSTAISSTRITGAALPIESAIPLAWAGGSEGGHISVMA